MQVNRDVVSRSPSPSPSLLLLYSLLYSIFIAIAVSIGDAFVFVIVIAVVIIIRIREISNSTQIKRRQNNCRGSVKMRPQTHSGRGGVNFKCSATAHSTQLYTQISNTRAFPGIFFSYRKFLKRNIN